MLRFFYILFLFPKYTLLYLLMQAKVYRQSKPKLLRNFFEEAGGAFIKFGQLLALRVDVLPKEYNLELFDLFDQVKPFPYSEVERIFRYELGAAPEKIFPYFERKPFASASFGQVHAAKLDNDQKIIVKVQRPGIKQKVVIDLMVIDLLSILADLFFKIEAMPWKDFAREFKIWTRKELDYQVEAENAERIYESVARVKNSKIIIPKTHHQFSTKKILVQEYIDGVPLSRILKEMKKGKLTDKELVAMDLDLKQAPITIVSELMRQYFSDGFFHADPHPGNILLLGKGKIGIIDFGIAGEAAPKREAFFKFVTSGAEENFQKAGYHFLEFAGGDLKQVIRSAIPAHVSQKDVGGAMELLADHFSEYCDEIGAGVRKDLEVMKIDYAVMVFRMLRFAQRYYIKIPKEMFVFVRALGVISFLAKEMNYHFRLTDVVLDFSKTFPKETFAFRDLREASYKRLNRELAIDRLNNWMSYLLEIDPKLYQRLTGYLAEKELFVTK